MSAELVRILTVGVQQETIGDLIGTLSSSTKIMIDMAERIAFLERQRDDLHATTNRYRARYQEAERKVRGYQWHMNECEQIAGKVLGYPWYKDDQDIFPGATESDGVCVGEHVADSIVSELANLYESLMKGCAPEKVLVADYTNHKGVRRTRTIRPTGRMIYGSTNWHHDPEWMIEAFAEDGVRKFFPVSGFGVDEFASMQARDVAENVD